MSQTIIPPQYDPAKGLTLFETQQAIDKIKVNFILNLENALNTWNEKLAEIWLLITQTPDQFKGGTIWQAILDIHGALQAIGLALLVLFFVMGVVKTCGSFADVNFC